MPTLPRAGAGRCPILPKLRPRVAGADWAMRRPGPMCAKPLPKSLHVARKNATLTNSTGRRGKGAPWQCGTAAGRRGSFDRNHASWTWRDEEPGPGLRRFDGNVRRRHHRREGGDVLVLAPGVTISGGDVTNETGIGVVIGGGTSAGAAPGGGTNSSVVE